MVCVASIQPDTFASGLLGYLDCQAATLGQQGFAALAAPGSSVSLLLAAFLTILVALAGYRMLLGEVPGVREGVLTVAKIGIVLALATSWPAYRTLVYDIVLKAPAQLAGEIARPAGLPDADSGLPQRMDTVDRSLRILAIYGTGVPTREQVEAAEGVAPPLFANFDVFALGMARLVFLVGGLGPLALLRLLAGLLLATGPLFAAFLLFASTRGLAEGWLRGLVATVLGSTAATIAVAIELALLEPWLADLAAQRAATVAIPGAPTSLLAATTIFALATSGLIAALARVAFDLSFEERRWSVSGTTGIAGEPTMERRVPSLVGAPVASEARSRASTIADSIVAAQRREETASGMIVAQSVAAGTARGRSDVSTPTVTPLGHSMRRTSRRVSSGAQRRDRT